MADFEQALGWLADDRVSVGELADVRPLADGPDAFARLAAGPPPAQVKVFLAGAGRES
jgi:threonine dehydrogenase-like Zn-dependent dehydrogenase